ncbi:unnamed protein product [Rotaria magnacalcarata]|uniref:Uncharacterized protein n=1 Tax=Rotaria magnacalcarata TaxID=392030 RepID=A0A816QW52_9BILA|nr:unnamed protein product [Rotaria magnacalcarata]
MPQYNRRYFSDFEDMGKIYFNAPQQIFMSLKAREVTIDDVKRAYEVFLDDARFSNNLHEYEQYFMFNDLSNDQQQTQSKMET